MEGITKLKWLRVRINWINFCNNLIHFTYALSKQLILGAVVIALGLILTIICADNGKIYWL
jgi:hypothetical protein